MTIRTTRTSMRWVLFSALAVSIGTMVYVGVLFNSSVEFDRRKFSSPEWKKYPEKRFELVDDLIHSKCLNGKSRIEVIELLGQPETNTPKQAHEIRLSGLYRHFPDTTGSGTDLFYFLGTRPGILQPEQYLFIWLENGCVSTYRIRGTFD